MTSLEARQESTVIVVNNDGIGAALPALRHSLIPTCLKSLDQDGWLPEAICLLSHGVDLVVEGSPVLTRLQAFQT